LTAKTLINEGSKTIKISIKLENLIGSKLDIEKDLRKLAEKHIKSRMEVKKLTKEIKKLKRV